MCVCVYIYIYMGASIQFVFFSIGNLGHRTGVTKLCISGLSDCCGLRLGLHAPAQPWSVSVFGEYWRVYGAGRFVGPNLRCIIGSSRSTAGISSGGSARR